MTLSNELLRTAVNYHVPSVLDQTVEKLKPEVIVERPRRVYIVLEVSVGKATEPLR
jgi:hypothetical protein